MFLAFPHGRSCGAKRLGFRLGNIIILYKLGWELTLMQRVRYVCEFWEFTAVKFVYLLRISYSRC